MRSISRAILLACLLIVPLCAGAQALLDELVAAVANDRADEVRSLLARGLDPNSVDSHGNPLLLIASGNGSAATVDALLAAKAKVDVANAYNDTPMLVASIKGYTDVVRRLRAAGASLDPPGWTPLIPNTRWADPKDARVPSIPR